MHSINLSAQISDIKEPSVKLTFVLACYNSGGKMFFEMAKAKDGRLLSFLPINADFIKRFLGKIYWTVRTTRPNEDEIKQTKPFFKPVLWVSKSGYIIYSDEPCTERTMLYLGKEIKLHNLPKLIYVASKDSMHVFEEVTKKGKEPTYLPANLPNINAKSGAVCTGNSTVKLSSEWMADLIKISYDNFWTSSFTSHSDATKNDWSKGHYRYKQRDHGILDAITLEKIIETC